jgi:ferredoxin
VIVIVDREKCDAQGVCTNLCPKVFELNDDDELEVLDPSPPEELRSSVVAAARACPEGAITVQ